MITARSLAISVFCTLVWTPLIAAQDFSRYREFQFGMSLPTVAKQADVKQSEAKAVHQRPADDSRAAMAASALSLGFASIRPGQRRPLQLLQWGAFPNGGELRSRQDPRLDQR